jgi:hypothetical protein
LPWPAPAACIRSECSSFWRARFCRSPISSSSTFTVVGAHFCEHRDARVVWFLAELTPLQQDSYVERLFDDESWTVQPAVEEADLVALLEAHLRCDEAAINDLVDATNECDLFEATVGFLVAAFGEDQVAVVLNEWRRRYRSD